MRREKTREIEALWRWRDGVSIAATAQRGGKVSEDIVVPLDRLEEAIEETPAIGARYGLPACSWGHAGTATCMPRSSYPLEAEELERAERASQDLFALAVSLGGSVTGEHGVASEVGATGWSPKAAALMAAVKQAFRPSRAHEPREEGLILWLSALDSPAAASARRGWTRAERV